MPYPRLRFETCRLVRFEEHHLTERYVSWLNDPAVVRYSEQRHQRHSLASCDSYFRSFAASENYFLAIEAQEAVLGHIGNISVNVDRVNGTADLSILIGERLAAGRGLATTAWQGLMHYLLAENRLRKVTAGTMSTNHSMLKLIERSGMFIEGRRSRQFVFEGGEADLVFAAKFKSP